MRTKAKIKCVTYGGWVGWILRRYLSKYTSRAYLQMQYFLRRPVFKKYVDLFYKKMSKNHAILPCLISIETINRCNSTCEFCPANRNTDKRPFARMEESLFKKIITELAEINYDGYLNLYINNEPFIDNRIEEWYQYAKESLPKAKMLLYTNGTLLREERFRKIIPFIDKMIINNYSENLELHDNIKKIYELVKNAEEYWNKDIIIQKRYIKEILSNRAGSAPNKHYVQKNHKMCIMPFTDFSIYPNGTVGICCNDALEKTNLGNVSTQSLWEIWTSQEYEFLRKTIGRDRSSYAFCNGCDFVDAGIRNIFIKDKLKIYGHL